MTLHSDVDSSSAEDRRRLDSDTAQPSLSEGSQATNGSAAAATTGRDEDRQRGTSRAISRHEGDRQRGTSRLTNTREGDRQRGTSRRTNTREGDRQRGTSSRTSTRKGDRQHVVIPCHWLPAQGTVANGTAHHRPGLAPPD